MLPSKIFLEWVSPNRHVVAAYRIKTKIKSSPIFHLSNESQFIVTSVVAQTFDRSITCYNHTICSIYTLQQITKADPALIFPCFLLSWSPFIVLFLSLGNLLNVLYLDIQRGVIWYSLLTTTLFMAFVLLYIFCKGTFSGNCDCKLTMLIWPSGTWACNACALSFALSHAIGFGWKHFICCCSIWEIPPQCGK